jgi:hypothetical protein
VKLTLTVKIIAVEFRRLTSFEWAVLSLLDIFGENVPDLGDAAIQLCIGEPAFLATALENLRGVGALQPRTDETRRLDLKDFDLSEAGETILRENGWEKGAEENLTEEVTVDWPSLTFHSTGKRGEPVQVGPSLDDVQKKITPVKIEEWLNRIDSRYWRVKSFYLVNVGT